jgi:hypothetical protein
MRTVILFLTIMVLFSCTTKIEAPQITITKTGNNSIKFTGLDQAAIQQLENDSTSASSWQSVIPVYKMPADTDLKDYQPVQPGKYAIADNTVIFTPDTPFVNGQTYFVRYYDFAQGSSLTEHILHHSKMGQHAYTDLIFKQ